MRNITKAEFFRGAVLTVLCFPIGIFYFIYVFFVKEEDDPFTEEEKGEQGKI